MNQRLYIHIIFQYNIILQKLYGNFSRTWTLKIIPTWILDTGWLYMLPIYKKHEQCIT